MSSRGSLDVAETERGRELVDRTTLSDREADVVALLEAGLSRPEIAEELDLAKGTIDGYAGRAREKFDLARRTSEELAEVFE